MRGIESAYVSLFIVFIQLYELKNTGELQCIGCFFLFLIHSKLIHSLLLFSSSVMSNSLWTAAHQASLPFTISQNLLKLMSLELVMPPTRSSSVVPFSCLQSFPATGSFLMSWLFTSKFWSSSISPSNEYSGLISFRKNWFDLLAVQGSLLQHHSSKASILQCSAFFTVQLSHLYMTTGKTTALTIPFFDYTVCSTILDLCWKSDVSAF